MTDSIRCGFGTPLAEMTLHDRKLVMDALKRKAERERLRDAVIEAAKGWAEYFGSARHRAALFDAVAALVAHEKGKE